MNTFKLGPTTSKERKSGNSKTLDFHPEPGHEGFITMWLQQVVLMMQRQVCLLLKDMSVFPGSRDSFCHRFWTACSSCDHNLQCFWGKLLQRCVQPSYLPVDAALNLLLSANIAAALTALISGPNSSNQTILNFCCICLCLTFAGFSFPIVARNYSKLSLFCTWLFVCF